MAKLLLINKDKLDAVLKMSLKHQAQLMQMIRTMLAESEQNIVQLTAWLNSGQHELIQAKLHKIRGGFATLGAEALIPVSKSLEQAIEVQHTISTPALSDFIRLYRQTCQQMQQHLDAFTPAAQAEISDDLPQLLSQLRESNMQACEQALACREKLHTLLGETDTEQLLQLINGLQFEAAATLLSAYLHQAQNI